MERFLRGHISNFIAGLLLAIVSLYYVNSTMFSHTHVIDGATIVHSHIYCADHTDGENDDTKHTKSELTLIQHLNDIILLRSESIPSVILFTTQIEVAYILRTIDLITQYEVSLSSPRAPPVLAA